MSSNDPSSTDINENAGILTRSQRKQLLEQQEINNDTSNPDDETLSSESEEIESDEDIQATAYVKKQSQLFSKRQSKSDLNGIVIDFVSKYIVHNITNKLQNSSSDDVDNEYIDNNGYYTGDGFVVSDNYNSDDSEDSEDYEQGKVGESIDDGYETDYEPINNRLSRAITPVHSNQSKYHNMNKEEISTCQQYMNIMKTYNRNTPESYFIKMDAESKKKIIEQEKLISQKLMANTPLRFQILNSNLPDNIKALAIAKVNIIEGSDSNGSDYYKIKEWLDGLLQIPFGKDFNMPIGLFSPPHHIREFLQNSGNILNNAIYGQIDTKTHVIQIISQLISNPDSIGNVFSIYGPMGTGKTSLVKNGIAKVLGRPFTLISLGGMTDSSFFRGHSYTYEGSRPGKIIEILRDSKCMNPIIYFDELDKVSDTPKGEEIIHTLIHLTDKSQNMNFQDHYYSGVPLDLSKIIFIFSYNDENKINPILRDRMYKIPVKGFQIDEKTKIAKDYLLNTIYKNFNFNSSSIYFSDEVIYHIISHYTKDQSGRIEEGVRTLERCLETIVSKLNVLRLYNENKSAPHSFANYPVNDNINNKNMPDVSHNGNVNINTENMDNEDLRLEIEKINQPVPSIYNYKMPYTIPELSFPLVITPNIVSKLLSTPQLNPSMQMMYS
jgi:ATP-dependent Lon protease